MKHILIVEDDKALSNGIVMALHSQEVHIEQCFNMASTRDTLSKIKFDLIILDINLPDGNGLNILHVVKKSTNTSIILLTANDMETDIVAGLEMGADDYITKPFSLAVLRARVNTQLRKQGHVNTTRFEENRFIFDFDRMEYYKDNYPIELSKTEQKLLRILVENRGRTLERGLLIDRIWTDGADYVDENALSVTIKRLRDKLEDTPAKPSWIKTAYGIGYTWAVK